MTDARPVATWDIWRRRKDPKPPLRSPAPALRQDPDADHGKTHQ